MNKLKILLIPLFLSLFLIIFSLPVYAKETYSQNGVFEYDDSYYVIEDQSYDGYECGFLFWSATCFNTSENFNYTFEEKELTPWSGNNTLVMHNTNPIDGLNQTLRFIPLTDPYFIKSNDGIETSAYINSSAMHFIPVGKEVIISVGYRINGTGDMKATLTQLRVYGSMDENIDNLDFIESFQLAPIDNTAVNQTFFLDAQTDYQYYVFALRFTWSGMDNTTTFEMDRFKIYSYDESYYLNGSYSSTACSVYCDSSESVNDLIKSANRRNIDDNKDYGFDYINVLEDEISCGCIILGDAVSTRRITDLEGYCSYCTCDNYDCFNCHAIMRDFAVTTGYNVGGTAINPLLFKAIDDDFIQAICINSTYLEFYPFSVLHNEMNYIQFNGVGKSSLTELCNLSIGSFTTFPTNTLAETITGTQFRKVLLGNGCAGDPNYYDYHDFFENTCENRIYCQFGYVYSVDASCNSELLEDCNIFGCNDEGTACDYPYFGTYCVNNYNYQSNFVNGTTSFNSCYPNLCFNLTGNTTIGCYATEEDYETALFEATQNLEFAEANPVEYIGYTLAGLFSIRDPETALNFSSLLLSIIIAVIVSLLVARKSKKTDFPIKVFEITAFIMIFAFTIAGWFSAWAFGVIIFLMAVIYFGLHQSGKKEG